MELVVLFLLFIGLLLLYVAVKYYNKECPQPKIEYRLIPRTLDEQYNDVLVSDTFAPLFNQTNLL